MLLSSSSKNLWLKPSYISINIYGYNVIYIANTSKKIQNLKRAMKFNVSISVNILVSVL